MRDLFRKLKNVILRCCAITGRKYALFACDMVGIGNRLIGLANLMCWEGNDHVRLWWSVDDWVNAPFEDLFRFDIADFKCHSFNLGRLKMSVSFAPFPHSFQGLYWSFFVPKDCGELRSVDFKYDCTPAWALKRYRPFFEKLLPSEKVLRRLCALKLPTNYVGVHIRNSSNVRDNPNKVALLEDYMRIMRSFPSDTNFFLSCHQKMISDAVHRAFPGRIYELTEKDYHNMVDAVADLYFLGRGASMICAPGSTFSECAWWWGGARITAIEVSGER